MNIRRILGVVTGAVLLSSLTTGFALAQPETPGNCADGIAARIAAQSAFETATNADEAAADAKADDDAIVTAENQLAEARERALAAGVPNGDQNQASVVRLRAELETLEDIPTSERSVEQQNRIEQIRERLPLIEAVVSAERELSEAREVAGRTDAVALARVAAQTDAETLKFQLDAAVAAANEACKGQEQPPAFVDLDCNQFPLGDGRTAQNVLDETPDADPHRLDQNNNRIACEVVDENATPDVDNAPVPAGGVDTGDGSSL